MKFVANLQQLFLYPNVLPSLSHFCLFSDFYCIFSQICPNKLLGCGCGCSAFFHFSSLHVCRSLNWQVWALHLFPLLFVTLSQGGIRADSASEMAGGMGMPLPWTHKAFKLQEERQSKFGDLNSRMMKNRANNHKRSRMWAPPLRSVNNRSCVEVFLWIATCFLTVCHKPFLTLYNYELLPVLSWEPSAGRSSNGSLEEVVQASMEQGGTDLV